MVKGARHGPWRGEADAKPALPRKKGRRLLWKPGMGENLGNRRGGSRRQTDLKKILCEKKKTRQEDRTNLSLQKGILESRCGT